MNATLKQLINNKAVLDTEGQVVYMVGIVLASKKDGTIKSGISYTMDEIKEFKSYTSPELEEIDRLNSIITAMTEQQQETIAKEKQSKAKKSYKHLEAGEVRDIENLFEEEIFGSKEKVAVELVVNTYQTSQAVVSRIRNGIHPKSSEPYKAKILAHNLKDV